MSARLDNAVTWVGTAFVLLILLLAGLTVHGYHAYREAEFDNARLLRLQELRGIIIHSDEVLTMSASMAAATGDRRWEERYRYYEPLLQNAIEEAKTLVADSYDSAPAGATDAANVALGRMEADALERVREGRLAEAQAIFSSETYTTLKRLYAEGMEQIAEQLERASEHALEQSRRSGLEQTVALIGLLIAVGLLGAFVVWIVRRNQRLRGESEAELERLIEIRGEFLSRMNHAIRTPMTAIMGYSGLLLESEQVEGREHEQIGVIRRNGQQLLDILNHLIDLAELQGGQVMLDSVLISPFEIIGDSGLRLRENALERGLSVHLEYLGRIPAQIKTDPGRVRRILMILIGNAIEFTRSGGVRLVTRFAPGEAGESAELRIEVIDTGVGMSSEQCRHIFDAFPKGGYDPSRAIGGTGLGLAMAKLLARKLGGDLGVRSAQGSGSCFTLSIRVGLPEDVEWVQSPAVACVAEPPLDGSVASQPDAQGGPAPIRLEGRILVAEDTPDSRCWLAYVLHGIGLEVELAENGQIALEAVQMARDAGEPFDVILMDMQMPVLNGYDAVAQLRADGYEGPILALTSHTMEGDRERCLQAGCDGYASKPIDRKDLIKRLAGYLKKSASH